MNMDFMNSPFVVPVAGCALGAIAVLAVIWLHAQKRNLKAQERMTMITRGMSVAEIEKLLGTGDEDKRVNDPMRSLGRARRAGIVLVSAGVGLALFFVILSAVLQERDVLSGAAIGIVPIAIGIGFFIDYSLQKRELSRFGLDLGADPASHRSA